MKYDGIQFRWKLKTWFIFSQGRYSCWLVWCLTLSVSALPIGQKTMLVTWVYGKCAWDLVRTMKTDFVSILVDAVIYLVSIYNIYNKYTHIQGFFLVIFLLKITYFNLVIFSYITVYRQTMYKKKNILILKYSDLTIRVSINQKLKM